MLDEKDSVPAAPVPAQDHMRRRTIAGVRWVMFLNLATTPLSFLTNMILARSSPVSLGYYGAFQIFVGTCQTLLFFGGQQVFTRFVPTLAARDRLAFVVTYTAMAWTLIAGVFVLGTTVFPDVTAGVFEKFGDPPRLLALCLALVIVTRVAAIRLQFGLLSAARAALTQKSIILGFFIVALLGYGPLRQNLSSSPSTFIWSAGVAVHVLACAIGAANVRRLVPRPRVLRWFLPTGFWPAAFYSYMVTMVQFVYRNLAPVVVLMWIDVAALANLHACLRFDLLLKMVPVMFADVLAPAIARLDASGHRDQALRQVSTAVRAMFVLLMPVVLGLVLFADDAMALFGPAFRDQGDLLRIIVLGSLAGPMIQLGWGMVAAFGEFRAYLLTSIGYVLTALVLTGSLVSGMGLIGAAIAIAVGGLVHQLMIAGVLRVRVGFRLPMRVHVGWGCAAAACATATWFHPTRGVSVVLYIVFIMLFGALGGVRPREIRGLATQLVRRR